MKEKKSIFLNEPFSALSAVAEKYKDAYMTASPFPSIYFTDFFNPNVLEKVLNEFGDLSKNDATNFDDPMQNKFASKDDTLFGTETKAFINYLNSEEFLNFMQVLTGIEEPLIADPQLFGGGLHEIKKGGFLKIHADFNKQPESGLDRRINVLVYLNKDWKEEYGGHFELWDHKMENCVTRVLPSFNTLAIFSTSDFSFHGHPDPLQCPDHMSRKSIALYYYSNGRPESEINPNLSQHNTLFKERIGNANDNDSFAHKKSIIKKLKKEIARGIRRLKI